MAVRSAKTGQYSAARVMFRQLLSQDKHDERAMLWLAKLASTTRERRQWLDLVIRTNPDNHTAIKALERLDYEQAAARNRRLLMVALGVGAVLIILVSILLILSVAASA
jgi:hypothetical protein